MQVNSEQVTHYHLIGVYLGYMPASIGRHSLRLKIFILINSEV